MRLPSGAALTRSPLPALLSLPLLLAHGCALADDAPTVAPQQKVLIVGTTMLPGAGTPLNQVPGNVQVLEASAVATRRAATLAQALDQGAGSVNVNDTAGNAYQLDVNFRGFSASPGLGTPQGLSVFPPRHNTCRPDRA